MEKTYIYGLIDPRPEYNCIRYVGKSNNPDKRLKQHIASRNQKNSHKNHWLRKLINKHIRPVVVILEEAPINDWKTLEKSWIKKLSNLPLVNVCKGGEGGDTFTNDPNREARRKKMKENMIGDKNPQFGKRGFNTGKKFSKEHVEKISKSLKGKFKSDKTKKLISKNRKNKMTGLDNHMTKSFKVIYENNSCEIIIGSYGKYCKKKQISTRIFYQLLRKERRNYKGIKTIEELQ